MLHTHSTDLITCELGPKWKSDIAHRVRRVHPSRTRSDSEHPPRPATSDRPQFDPNRTPLSYHITSHPREAAGGASPVHSAQAIQRALPGRTPARPGESSSIAGENVGGFQLRAQVGGHSVAQRLTLVRASLHRCGVRVRAVEQISCEVEAIQLAPPGGHRAVVGNAGPTQRRENLLAHLLTQVPDFDLRARRVRHPAAPRRSSLGRRYPPRQNRRRAPETALEVGAGVRGQHRRLVALGRIATVGAHASGTSRMGPVQSAAGWSLGRQAGQGQGPTLPALVKGSEARAR